METSRGSGRARKMRGGKVCQRSISLSLICWTLLHVIDCLAVVLLVRVKLVLSARKRQATDSARLTRTGTEKVMIHGNLCIDIDLPSA